MRTGPAVPTGKKTLEAVKQETAREVERLTQKIFADRRKTGRLDLEAIETFVRESMQRAGGAALSHLLNVDPPEQHSILCRCGQSTGYREQRGKPILTVAGPVGYERPYYVCDHCHHAPNPTDAALGVAGEEFSPGVRRMMAVVGGEAAFDVGREQLELLAGLHVSTKPVERQAQRIGAEIMRFEQADTSSRPRCVTAGCCSSRSCPPSRASTARSLLPARCAA